VGWITSSTLRDTSPNAAFAAEPVDGGVTDLVSPVFPITTSTAQLSFRQNFNFESDPAVLSNAFDGGVLEIRIGGGPFQDILTAGGSFVTNGYNRSISPTNTDNPLFGRQVWSALSGGFITTTANLPAAAAGQTVQLKWRLGTDIGNFDGGLGWYIDGISVQDGYSCCTPNADMAMGQSAAPNPVLLGGNVAFTLGITNLGPGGASSVTITDTLPANVTFVSASAGASNSSGTVVWQLGSVSAGVSTNISVTVKPLAAGYFTNLVTLFSSTADPASANNTTTQVVTAMAAPVLTSLSLGGGGISVSVSSVVGVNYQLEYKRFLTDPSWNLLGPAVPGTGGVIILQDTNAPAAASRFYRVACTSNL
jgi:uncharacterized repeat protein (TIGR01451 family)